MVAAFGELPNTGHCFAASGVNVVGIYFICKNHVQDLCSVVILTLCAQNKEMTRLRDFCILTLCAFCFVTILAFSAFFGGQALQMMGTFAKHSVGIAEPRDYLYVLAECRVHDYQICSDLAAERVIQKFPGNILALGHLAVRSVKSKDFDKAASLFAAYFSQGGASAEANFWYSQLLLEQGEEEKAVRWSYLAVLQDPENETYAKALHELLVEMDKSLEALALIGFITKGRPQGHRYWSAEIARLEKSSVELEKMMKGDISIPIRGEEAYVPAVQASDKKLRFFKVIGRNCDSCPASLNMDKAKVVSKLEHNFLVLTQ